MKIEFENSEIKKLIELYQPIWTLSYFSRLSGWDYETFMPPAGADDNGYAQGKASVMMKDIYLSKDFQKQLDICKAEEGLNVTEKAIIRKVTKAVENYKKLPSDFLEEISRTTSKALTAWKAAKKDDNSSVFLPHLEKVVNLSRRTADYLGYEDHPYDALLDNYETDQTTEYLDKYFKELIPEVRKQLKKITSADGYKSTHPLEHEEYDIGRAKELNQKVLKFLQYEDKRLRMDESTHPFTQSLTKNDVRITTRYSGKDIAGSFLGTLHEYGHALYELQSSPKLERTPIAGGSSLGIHESQSRFWENHIGRSKDFFKLIKPELDKLGDNFAKYSVDDWFQYANTVRPSLIRTEADQITYHFHIYIRYEIEKLLILGELSVKDVEEKWNSMYEEHLGVSATKDNPSQGFLQDIHWSQAAIGYFPTYSTGTTLSGKWLRKMQNETGLLKDSLKLEDIPKIKKWQEENIHKYGSIYTFREVEGRL